MSKPIAVCISDLHFNLQNLELATQALSAALKKAEDIDVPLIIAGDLTDTKAIIRGEVANRLIEIIGYTNTEVHILVGNHDLINEKGIEHSLNFLRPYANIVDNPYWDYNIPTLRLIPYQNDISRIFRCFESWMGDPTKILIMHQGFQGANLGDYVQDKTSISLDLVKDFTVISGHYHKHQTIGTVTYIGSPYTITFGEANDGPKGFLILNEDGSFTREILQLRKHIVVSRRVEEAYTADMNVKPNDLLWLKISGPTSELKKLNKAELGMVHIGHENFKLELIPTNTTSIAANVDVLRVTDREILEKTIDNLNETSAQKQRLKELANALVDSKSN